MNNRLQSGFTLVEFMVSLSIGLYLLGLGTFLYLSFQRTVAFNQGLSEIQENGQVAFAWLNREVRMAGFIGSPRLTDVTLSGPQAFTLSESLIGWHHGEYPTSFPLPKRNLAKESDILLLQYADPQSIPILHAQANQIVFRNRADLHPKTVLLLSDCHHAETTALESVNLQHTYQQGTHVSPLYKILYYVAATSRKNKSNRPIYALYRKDLHAPLYRPTELIEGIEKMQIRYGIATTTGQINYIPANAVRDWSQVRSVRITLHLSSLEQVNFPSSIQANRGKPSSLSSDRRLKRQWQQTIMLRNRGDLY